MHLSSNLAEAISDGEQLDDLVVEFGGAAYLDPAAALAILDVGGRRRE